MHASCRKHAYLVGGPGGDEDGIPKTLHNGVAVHSVLLQQAIAQLFVQVPALIMDRVVVWLDGLATLPGHLENKHWVM